MPRRTYAQFCPAARALDVVGERWTILLVRELLLGRKRYTDLLEGLPGIGPNVLAFRLRQLQEAGLVRKVKLPPPAASTVYELTELGEGLRPIVRELTRWGLNFLGPPQPSDHFRLGWVLSALEASFRPELARGVRESYEYRIDGDAFHVRVDDGRVAVRQGPAPDAAFVLTTDLDTFVAMGARLLSPTDALAAGQIAFDGDLDAAERSIAILGPHLSAIGTGGGALGALRARFVPELARGVHEAYEFRVDGQAFHLQVHDGEADVRPGPAARPAAVFTLDLETFLAVGLGRLTPGEAREERHVEVEGDEETVRRALAMLGIPADALVPA